MRKIGILTLSVLLMLSSVGFAKPEQVKIKPRRAESQQEKSLKSALKSIEPHRIQDPEARRAIREIIAYLNLPANK